MKKLVLATLALVFFCNCTPAQAKKVWTNDDFPNQGYARTTANYCQDVNTFVNNGVAESLARNTTRYAPACKAGNEEACKLYNWNLEQATKWAKKVLKQEATSCQNFDFAYGQLLGLQKLFEAANVR